MKMKTFTLLLLAIYVTPSLGQSVSLNDVFKLAEENTLQIQVSQNVLRHQNLQEDIYKASLLPQFRLNLDLIDYFKTSSPIVQPNGLITFTDLSQNNSSLSLGVSQVLPWTGGNVFVNTNLRRFDDYPNDFTSYNGVPVEIGIVQPLFSFNPYKHQKRLLSLKKKELSRKLQAEIENSRLQSTNLFFDVLIAQENKEIANINFNDYSKLHEITQQKYRQGNASKNDLLQLEIALENAKLLKEQTLSQHQQALEGLNTLLSTNYDTTHQFDIPEVLTSIEINHSRILSNAKDWNPNLHELNVQKWNITTDKRKTASELGISASIVASLGYAKSASNIQQVYDAPNDAQNVQVRISAPIWDWNLRKKSLESHDLLLKNIEIQKDISEREITKDINILLLQFGEIQKSLQLSKNIVLKSEERFSISKESYALGSLGITELTIAQRENNLAKQNFINQLKLYWQSISLVRLYSGYDLYSNTSLLGQSQE